MSLSIVLLHHPMTDKCNDVVTTSITNFDIHDLARSAMTFGLHSYWLVHPVPTQRHFAERILRHWLEGWGSTYNATRKEALSVVRLASDLGEVAEQLEMEHPGTTARFIATSAKRYPNALTYDALRRRLDEQPEIPQCLIFGTGWGLHPLVFEEVDDILEPISGQGEWNHLSVRAAAAIILDRLRGR